MRQRRSTILQLVQAVDVGPTKTNNPAVNACIKAYQKALKQPKTNCPEYEADKAYRMAMPSLGSRASIQGFIACTAHAVLIGIISGQEASRLLYAAQVALSTLKEEKTGRRIHAA